MHRIYPDREEAGRLLGAAVKARFGSMPMLVLGLPRGGVPLAVAVGRAIDAPVDVLVVRKVGMPSCPEVAMGAVAPGGITVRSEPLLSQNPDAAIAFEAVAARERAEVERRECSFRGSKPPLRLQHRTVLLVDDGIATGATVLAAIAASRRLGASRVIVAVPVASTEALARIEAEADDVVCLAAPRDFASVGEHYLRFPQLSDATVRKLLSGSGAVGRAAP